MKHILQFRKAAIGLLILLLITILTLTIPTKGHAQHVTDVHFYPSRISYGVETLSITEAELRRMANENGGFVPVSLRYYMALAPGHGLNIADNGFIIQAGGSYAFSFVDKTDLAAVIFAGVTGRMDARQHEVRQPTAVNAVISGGNSISPNNIIYWKDPSRFTYGPNYTMDMMAGVDAASVLVKNGSPSWCITSIPGGATGNAVDAGSYIQGNGTTTWDSIYIRRLAFVIHDVDEFINRGGFKVIADTLYMAIDNGIDPSYFHTLFPGCYANNNRLYCNGIGASAGSWLDPLACRQIADVVAGGVIVITTPQIRMPKTWRPCPTYTTDDNYNNRARLISYVTKKDGAAVTWKLKRNGTERDVIEGVAGNLNDGTWAKLGSVTGSIADTFSLVLTQAQVLGLKDGDSIIQYYTWDDGDEPIRTAVAVTPSKLAEKVRGTIDNGNTPNSASASVFYLAPIGNSESNLAANVLPFSGTIPSTYGLKSSDVYYSAALTEGYSLFLSPERPVAGAALVDDLSSGEFDPDFNNTVGPVPPNNDPNKGILYTHYRSFNYGASWGTNGVKQNIGLAVSSSNVTPTGRVYHTSIGFYGNNLAEELRGMEGCVVMSDTIIVKPLGLPKPPKIEYSWGCGDNRNLRITGIIPEMSDGSIPNVTKTYMVIRQEGSAVSNPLDGTNTVVGINLPITGTGGSTVMHANNSSRITKYTLIQNGLELIYSVTAVNGSGVPQAMANAGMFAFASNYSTDATSAGWSRSDYNSVKILNAKNPASTNNADWSGATGNKVYYIGYEINNGDTIVWGSLIGNPALNNVVAGKGAEFHDEADDPIQYYVSVVQSYNSLYPTEAPPDGKGFYHDPTKDTSVDMGKNVYVYPVIQPTFSTGAGISIETLEAMVVAGLKVRYEKSNVDPTIDEENTPWVSIKEWTGNENFFGSFNNANNDAGAYDSLLLLITEDVWVRIVVTNGTCVAGVSPARKISIKGTVNVGNIVGKSKPVTVNEMNATSLFNDVCYVAGSANPTKLTIRYDDKGGFLTNGSYTVTWEDSVAGSGVWTPRTSSAGIVTTYSQKDSVTYTISTPEDIYVRIKIEKSDEPTRYTPKFHIEKHEIKKGDLIFSITPSDGKAPDGAGICPGTEFKLTSSITDPATAEYLNLQIKGVAGSGNFASGSNITSIVNYPAVPAEQTFRAGWADATAHNNNYKYGLLANSSYCKPRYIDSVKLKVIELATGGVNVYKQGTTTSANNAVYNNEDIDILLDGAWTTQPNNWTIKIHRAINGVYSEVDPAVVEETTDTKFKLKTRAAGIKDSLRVVVSNGICDTFVNVEIGLLQFSLAAPTSDSACAYDNADYIIKGNLSGAAAVLQDSIPGAQPTWTDVTADAEVAIAGAGTTNATYTIKASRFTGSSTGYYYFRIKTNNGNSPKGYVRVFPKPTNEPVMNALAGFVNDTTICDGSKFSVANPIIEITNATSSPWEENGYKLKVTRQEWWVENSVVTKEISFTNSSAVTFYPYPDASAMPVDSGTYIYKAIYGYEFGTVLSTALHGKQNCYDTASIRFRHVTIVPVAQLDSAGARALKGSVCVGDSIRIEGKAHGLANAKSIEYKYYFAGASSSSDTVTKTYNIADGALPALDTATFIASVTRSYYVKITVLGEGSCNVAPKTSRSVAVTVNTTPSVVNGSLAGADIVDDTIHACAGDVSSTLWTYTATATPNPTYQIYKYNIATGNLSGVSNGVVPASPLSVASSGYYAIVATSTSGSCSDTGMIITPYLKVTAKPASISLSGSTLSSPICNQTTSESLIVTATASPADSFSYVWTLNGSVQPAKGKKDNKDTLNFDPSLLSAASYTYSVEVTAFNGACYTASVTPQSWTFTVAAAPAITWNKKVIVKADTGKTAADICKDRSLELSVNGIAYNAGGNNPDSVVWYKGEAGARVRVGGGTGLYKLDLGTADAADNGKYIAVVYKGSSTCISADTSEVKAIDVKDYARISTLTHAFETAPLNLCNNEEGVLELKDVGTVAGGHTLTYKWFKASAVIGGNSPDLTVNTTIAPNSASTNITSRLVLVNNTNGCKDSNSISTNVVRDVCGKPTVADSVPGAAGGFGTLSSAAGDGVIICADEDMHALLVTAVNSSAYIGSNRQVSAIQWQVSTSNSPYYFIDRGITATTPSTINPSDATPNAQVKGYLLASDINVPAGSTYYYRAKITRGTTPNEVVEYSDTVIYIHAAAMAKATDVSVTPESDTVCHGITAPFAASAEKGNAGYGALAYIWYKSDNSYAFTGATYSPAGDAAASPNTYTFKVVQNQLLSQGGKSKTCYDTTDGKEIKLYAVPAAKIVAGDISVNTIGPNVCDADGIKNIIAEVGSGAVADSFFFVWKYNGATTLETHGKTASKDTFKFDPSVRNSGTYGVTVTAYSQFNLCSASVSPTPQNITIQNAPTLDWDRKLIVKADTGKTGADICEDRNLSLSIGQIRYDGIVKSPDSVVWYKDNVRVNKSNPYNLGDADAAAHNGEYFAVAYYGAGTCKRADTSARRTIDVKAYDKVSALTHEFETAPLSLCNDEEGVLKLKNVGSVDGGHTLTYKWFKASAGIGGNSSELTVNTTIAPNGTSTNITSRLVLVNNTNGCKDSSSIIASVQRNACDKPIVSDSVPGSAGGFGDLSSASGDGVTICANEDMHTLAVTAVNSATYVNSDRRVTGIKWEVSTDGGGTFGSVSGSAVIDPAYPINPAAAVDSKVKGYLPASQITVPGGSTYYYRAEITRNGGSIEYSDKIAYFKQAAMASATGISVNPTSDTVCYGSTATFTASAGKGKPAYTMSYIWYDTAAASSVLHTANAFTVTGNQSLPYRAFEFRVLQEEAFTALTAPAARSCYDTSDATKVRLYTDSTVNIGSIAPAGPYNVCEAASGDIISGGVSLSGTSGANTIKWAILGGSSLTDTLTGSQQYNVSSYNPAADAVTGFVPDWNTETGVSVTRKLIAIGYGKYGYCAASRAEQTITLYRKPVKVTILPDGEIKDTVTICAETDVILDISSTTDITKFTPGLIAWKYVNVSTGVETVLPVDGGNTTTPKITSNTLFTAGNTYYVYGIMNNPAGGGACSAVYSDTVVVNVISAGSKPTYAQTEAPLCFTDRAVLHITSFGRAKFSPLVFKLQIDRGNGAGWVTIPNSEISVADDGLGVDTGYYAADVSGTGVTSVTFRLVDSASCGLSANITNPRTVVTRAKVPEPAFAFGDTLMCLTDVSAFNVVAGSNTGLFHFQFVKDTVSLARMAMKNPPSTNGIQNIGTNFAGFQHSYSPTMRLKGDSAFVRYFYNHAAPNNVCVADTSGWIFIKAGVEPVINLSADYWDGTKDGIGSIGTICETETTLQFNATMLRRGTTITSWYLVSGNDTIDKDLSPVVVFPPSPASASGAATYSPALSIPGYLPEKWTSTDTTRKVIAKVESPGCPTLWAEHVFKIRHLPPRPVIKPNGQSMDTIFICPSDHVMLDITDSLGTNSLYFLRWPYLVLRSNGSFVRLMSTSTDPYDTDPTFPRVGGVGLDVSPTDFKGGALIKIWNEVDAQPCGIIYSDTLSIRVIDTASVMNGHELAVSDVDGNTIPNNSVVCMQMLNLNEFFDTLFKGGGLPKGVTLTELRYIFKDGTELPASMCPIPLKKGKYDIIAYLNAGDCPIRPQKFTITIIDSVPKLDISKAILSQDKYVVPAAGTETNYSPGFNNDTIAFCSHDNMKIERAGIASDYKVEWFISGREDMSDARSINNTFLLNETWEPKYNRDTMYYAYARTSLNSMTGTYGCESVLSDTLKIKVVAVENVNYIQQFPDASCVLDSAEFKFVLKRSILDMDNLLLFVDTTTRFRTIVNDYTSVFDFSKMVPVSLDSLKRSGDTFSYKYLFTNKPAYAAAGFDVALVFANVVGNGCYFGRLGTPGHPVVKYDTMTLVHVRDLMAPNVVNAPNFLNNMDGDTSICGVVNFTLNANPLTPYSGHTNTTRYAFDVVKDTNNISVSDIGTFTNGVTSKQINFPPSPTDTVRYVRYRIDHWQERTGTHLINGVSGVDKYCPPDTSQWVKIIAYPRPRVEITNKSAISVANPQGYCEDEEITLKYSWERADTVRLFKNGVLDTTIKTTAIAGNDSIKLSLDKTAVYVFMASNSAMAGTAGCYVNDTIGGAVSVSGILLTVFDSTVKGSLAVTNPLTSAVDALYNDKLMVSDNFTLKVNGSNEGPSTKYSLEYVHALKPAAVDLNAFEFVESIIGVQPTWTDQTNRSLHMDSSYFRVIVTNGVCPSDTTNMVWITVTESESPSADKEGVATALCEGTPINWFLTHSTNYASVVGNVADNSVLWYAKNTGTGVITALNNTALNGKDTLKGVGGNLPAGDYEFFAIYELKSPSPGNHGNSDTTKPFNIKYTQGSDAGVLALSNDELCENSGTSVLLSSGTVGNLTGLLFSKDSVSWTSIGGYGSLPNVITLNAALADSGYYRIIVRTGTGGCLPDTSDAAILFTVYPTPDAGIIKPADTTVVYGGTATLTLSGYSIAPEYWEHGRSDQPDVLFAGNNPYIISNITDRDTVFVSVSSGICAEDNAIAVIRVYDSLVANLTDNDITIIEDQNTVIPAVVGNAGLEYPDGTGTPREDILSKGVTWQWYSCDQDSTNCAPLTNGSDYSGTNTPNLTVTWDGYDGNENNIYYAIVTSNIDPVIVIKTDTVSIRKIDDTSAGEIQRIIDGDCYFAGDTAVYFVKATGDSLWIKWELYADGGGYTDVSAAGLDYQLRTVEHSDTIRFSRTSDLIGYDSLIAYVYDKQYPGGFARRSTVICMQQNFPKIALLEESTDPSHRGYESDTFCFNEPANLSLVVDTTGSGLKLSDYVIVKGYVKLKTDPGFNEVNGTVVEGITIGVSQPDPYAFVNSTGGFTFSSNNFNANWDSAVFKLDVSYRFTSKAVDTSLYFVIRVGSPVTAVAMLDPDTVCIGSNVDLKATVTMGSGIDLPLTITWIKGSSSIIGSQPVNDTATYGVANADPAVLWSFAADNACNGKFGNGWPSDGPKQIVVDSAPLAKGTNVVIVMGDTGECSPAADIKLYCTDSSGKFNYQWQFNDGSGFKNIDGANDPHYFMTPAYYSNRGQYRVAVSPSGASDCPLTDTVKSNFVIVNIDTVPLLNTSAFNKRIELSQGDKYQIGPGLIRSYPLLNNSSDVRYSEWYIRVKYGNSLGFPVDVITPFNPGDGHIDTVFIDNSRTVVSSDGTDKETRDLVINYAPIWLDSAIVFAKVENDCGIMVYDTFYIFIAKELVITDYDTMDMYVSCVSDETAEIGVITNIRPDKATWYVSNTGAIGSFTTLTPADTTSFNGIDYGQFLTVNDVENAIGKYYVVVFNDSVHSDTIRFHIDDKVAFAGTGLTNPFGIRDTTIAKGKCLTFGYDGSGFVPAVTSDIFHLVMIAVDTFNLPWSDPSNDSVNTKCFTETGIYTYSVGVYNHCGGDTVSITITVEEAVKADTLIVDIPEEGVHDTIVKEPGTSADDPLNKRMVSVCESDSKEILLHIPDNNGVRTEGYWEIIPQGSSTWISIDDVPAPDNAVFSYRGSHNDTLVIGAPVHVTPLDQSTYRFISVSAIGRDTSVYIQVIISSNDHDNFISPKLSMIDSAVDFTITYNKSTTATGTQTTEWYQIDREGNVSPLDAGNGFNESTGEFTPAGGFNTADHDSLRIYFVTTNACGDKVYSDTALIRLFTPVDIEWKQPEVEQEYVFCEGEQDLLLPIEILSGSLISGSRDTIVFETAEGGAIAPPFYVEGMALRINGELTYVHNGMEFRAIAFTAWNGTSYGYSDTTSFNVRIVVQDFLPDIVLLPSDTLLCESGDVEFVITPAPSAGIGIQWFEGDTRVDTGANVSYIRNFSLADSGLVIKAVISNICGTDTASAKVRVQTPDTAMLSISSDTASCFNSELTFASSLQMKSGENVPAGVTITWYAQGIEPSTGIISLGSGDSLTISSLDVGRHKVWAVATFLPTECMAEYLYSDTTEVIIYGLPEITYINANPNVITVGESTWVSVGYEPNAEGSYVRWANALDVLDSTSVLTQTRPSTNEDRPTWKFIATVTDSNGCKAMDSVEVTIRTNLELDSIFVDETITSDIPDENDIVVQTVVWRNDTAYLNVCPQNKVALTLFTTGGDHPLKYEWHGKLPVDGATRTEAEGDTVGNEVFEFEDLDGFSGDWYCVITDNSGNTVTAYVLLTVKQTVKLVLEATPKMDLAKYYQNQRVQIHASPGNYSIYTFYQYENDVLVKKDSGTQPNFKTNFNYHESRNSNVIYASAIDANSCRITGELEIGVLPMPNVMILNDPRYPNDNVIFPNFRITVYNSWGLKIKDRNDGYGWDGTDRAGKQVESGTYFYYVEIKTETGIETINGAVTVFKK
jgi:hypothetical protein